MSKINLSIYRKYINESELIYDVSYLVIDNDDAFYVLLGKVDSFDNVIYYAEINNFGELIYPRILNKNINE